MSSVQPNRKHAPAFRAPDPMVVPVPLERTLDNGIRLFGYSQEDLEVIKVELWFEAGTWFQSAPLEAAATNALLSEGTAEWSSAQMAERIDYYGAHLQAEVERDTASVVLFTLREHLDQTLPVLEMAVKAAIFPEHEFQVHQHNARQQFLVNEEKSSNLAAKAFLAGLYGADHPYGRSAVAEDYDRLQADQLRPFYQARYRPDCCTILVSGAVNESMLDRIGQHFEGDWSRWPAETHQATLGELPGQVHRWKEREQAVQSALRIGRTIGNRGHADWPGMQVLNTILGGYFGSRLMRSLREEKGYTYGIYSGMASLRHGGYLYIASEVNAAVTGQALEEIYRQIKRLREEVVPESELGLVKNYMIGSFLRHSDGPFAQADRLKTRLMHGLEEDYDVVRLEQIKAVAPKTLQELANRYLQEHDLSQVVVGPGNLENNLRQ